MLRVHGTTALQYGTTEGSVRLREAIARQMARYGIVVPVDSIIITAGSQQALDLIAKVLLNPGDRILTETPSYLGAHPGVHDVRREYVTVPMDDDGMRIDTLETALRVGPKFMYVLPNFQNPSGVTLSLERRRGLVALSDDTASHSSKTIRTGSCATRASTSGRWWCSTPRRTTRTRTGTTAGTSST